MLLSTLSLQTTRKEGDEEHAALKPLVDRIEQITPLLLGMTAAQKLRAASSCSLWPLPGGIRTPRTNCRTIPISMGFAMRFTFRAGL